MLLRVALLLPAFLGIAGAVRYQEAKNATEIRFEARPPPPIKNPISDIKVKYKRKSAKCGYKASTFDWIEYHSKLYIDDKIEMFSTHYEDEPVRIQIGTGAVTPELAFVGACEAEILIMKKPFPEYIDAEDIRYGLLDEDDWDVPLAPKDHWMSCVMEVISITPFSLEQQFDELDVLKDDRITRLDLIVVALEMAESENRAWPNEDIDDYFAISYFISYFDISGDGTVNIFEFIDVVERDEKNRFKTDAVSAKPFAPGFERILDFNNDGVISQLEIDDAPRLFELGPTRLANQGFDMGS